MKNGFTVFELTVVMFITVVLLSIIIGNGTSLINRARFQATVREMGTIAQASIDYYNSNSSMWPTSVLCLAPIYMPQAVTSNQFDSGGYQLYFSNDAVTVSTMIPKGVLLDQNEGNFLVITSLGLMDQISITQNIPNEISGRLDYGFKHPN